MTAKGLDTTLDELFFHAVWQFTYWNYSMLLNMFLSYVVA